MANPAPSHLHERLREEELETPNEQILAEEGDTDDDNDDDEETTDDDEDDEEESPPRVLDSGQGSVGDGEKRRRVEKGGESCWMSGIESGDCSQGSQWNRTEIDGLFCPICMDAWTDNGDHHIREFSSLRLNVHILKRRVLIVIGVRNKLNGEREKLSWTLKFSILKKNAQL